MPDPNLVPPETTWDVAFALVGGISGLMATHIASYLVREANKPPVRKV